MLKTVKTTAIVTLAALLTVICTVFASAALFNPSSVARLCSGLGLKKVAVRYYESAYERDGDFSNLKNLIDDADYAGDYAAIARYGEEFLSCEDFAALCNNEEGSGAFSAYDYYCGLVVISLYENSEKAASAALSVRFTKEYTGKSPLGIAIRLAVKNKDKDYADFIKAEYEKGSVTTSDIEKLDSI
ncbi:MAG: hypothetical protein IJS67_02495 [Clostridia bacterium]|nr:hypothetical protein [Clostridia bacterium]